MLRLILSKGGGGGDKGGGKGGIPGVKYVPSIFNTKRKNYLDLGNTSLIQKSKISLLNNTVISYRSQFLVSAT